MEELDEEAMRDLEERLYAQVHHASLETEKHVSSHGIVESSPSNDESYRSDLNSTATQTHSVDSSNKEKSCSKPAVERDKVKEAVQKPVAAKYRKNSEQQQSVIEPKAHERKVRNPLFKWKQQKQTAAAKDATSTKTKKNKNVELFSEKMRRLKKAIFLERKRAKAKQAKAKQKTKHVETVCLLTSEEDNDDEVVHVPIPPQPIISLEDTDEDTKMSVFEQEQSVVKQELAFMKAPNDVSRCSSPCSVLSHDDFIGSQDRSRLSEPRIADDADLLMLTANVDSLLEAPIGRKAQEVMIEKNAQRDRAFAALNALQSEDVECTGSFITPNVKAIPKKQRNGFDVDQAEFPANDVYESESDLVSDSVYSKGASRNISLVRTVDSESEDNACAEDDTLKVNQKIKRLRKRRISSSRKSSESNPNQESLESSDDEDNEGVVATGIPYIAKGPAVDRVKNKRARKNSLSHSLSRTSLSEGGCDRNLTAEHANDEEEPNGDSESNRQFPSAREIVEKVLSRGKATKTTNKSADSIEAPATRITRDISAMEDPTADIPEAVPDFPGQDDIFKKLDELEANSRNTNKTPGDKDSDKDVVVVSSQGSAEENVEVESPPKDEDGAKVNFVIYTGRNYQPGIEGFGWNAEMSRFFNNSWNGEQLSIQKEWAKMRQDKHLWRISKEDQYPKFSPRSRLKCYNCFEMGHLRSKCTRPKRPLRCHMCGESGHLEPRCPHTCCMRCGNKTIAYMRTCNACSFQNRLICDICKTRGHSLNHCPDKWRRYHSTTEATGKVNSKIAYKKRKACCSCGRFGHLSEECRNGLRFNDYPLTVTTIQSHQPCYEPENFSPDRLSNGIAINLLYDPNAKVEYGFAESATATNVYGRFLKAVGLGDLMKKSKKKPVSEASEKTNEPLTNQPEQVAEVSESFVNSASGSEIGTPSAKKDANQERAKEHLHLDSDSNYSFSEHFELPSCSKAGRPAASSKPLADFIPLCSKEAEQRTHDIDFEARGISHRFVVDESDDDEDEDGHIQDKDDNDESMKDTENSPDKAQASEPCEAKIFITNAHSKYLLSPVGSSFLQQQLTNFNVTGRITHSAVGFTLMIYGLPENQDKLHCELLKKFKDLEGDAVKMREQQRSESALNNIPKRTEALIRYLRENLGQLMTNLGNVDELLGRLDYLERQSTKNSIKAADRVRRLLNMILLGQAGLLNGNLHLENLMGSLRTLLASNRSDEVTSIDLRHEIDASFKMIFSPYRHRNYADLVKSYNEMTAKNRTVKPKIDAQLLGRVELDTSFTREQRDRLKEAASNANAAPPVQAAFIDIDLTEASLPDKPEQRNHQDDSTMKPKLAKNDEQTLSIPSAPRNQNWHTKPTAVAKPSKQNYNSPYSIMRPNPKPENPAATGREFNGRISSRFPNNPRSLRQCNILLGDLDNSYENINATKKRDAGAASPFWSHESIKYINSCLQLSQGNQELTQRLQRVQQKAVRGLLSFNDYSATLKLYDDMMTG